MFALLLSQIKKSTYENISCCTEWISTAADLVTWRTPVGTSCWINVLEMLKRNFKQTSFSRRSKILLSGDHVKASGAVTQPWIRLVNSCLFSQQVTRKGSGSFSPNISVCTCLPLWCYVGRHSMHRWGKKGRLRGWNLFLKMDFGFFLKSPPQKKKLAKLYFESTDFQTNFYPKLEMWNRVNQRIVTQQGILEITKVKSLTSQMRKLRPTNV